jgi:hypothetical protein
MSGLDKLFTEDTRKGWRTRCAVCGSERTARVQVVVARVRGGRPVQGQMHAQSAPVCEKHAGELWKRLTGLLP